MKILLACCLLIAATRAFDMEATLKKLEEEKNLAKDDVSERTFLTKDFLAEALARDMINDPRLAEHWKSMTEDGFNFYFANALVDLKNCDEKFKFKLSIVDEYGGLNDLFMRNLNTCLGIWMNNLSPEDFIKIVSSNKETLDIFVAEISKIPCKKTQNEIMRKVVAATFKDFGESVCKGNYNFPAVNRFCKNVDIDTIPKEPSELLKAMKDESLAPKSDICIGISDSFLETADVNQAQKVFEYCKGDDFMSADSGFGIIFEFFDQGLSLKDVDIRIILQFVLCYQSNMTEEQKNDKDFKFPVSIFDDKFFREKIDSSLAVLLLNTKNIWKTADDFSEEALEVLLKYKQFSDDQLLASKHDSDSNLYKVVSKNKNLVSEAVLNEICPDSEVVAVDVLTAKSSVDLESDNSAKGGDSEESENSEKSKNSEGSENSEKEEDSDKDGGLKERETGSGNTTKAITSLDGLSSDEIKEVQLTPEIIAATAPLTESNSKGHPCHVLKTMDLPKGKEMDEAIEKLCPNVKMRSDSKVITSLDGLSADEIKALQLTPAIVNASTPLTESNSSGHPCHVLKDMDLPKGKEMDEAIKKLCPNVKMRNDAIRISSAVMLVLAAASLALF